MLSHQPFDRAARKFLLFSAELMPDLACSIAILALLVDTLNLLERLLILLSSVRGKLGITRNAAWA